MEAQLALGCVIAVKFVLTGDEADMCKMFRLEENTLTLEERITALEEQVA